MTYLGDMGLLSLGSQLKAISDQLYAMADEVYARHGIELQALVPDSPTAARSRTDDGGRDRERRRPDPFGDQPTDHPAGARRLGEHGE